MGFVEREILRNILVSDTSFRVSYHSNNRQILNAQEKSMKNRQKIIPYTERIGSAKR